MAAITIGRARRLLLAAQGLTTPHSANPGPSDITITDDLVTGLRDVLQRIATWHQTPAVVIRETNPRSLGEALAAKQS